MGRELDLKGRAKKQTSISGEFAPPPNKTPDGITLPGLPLPTGQAYKVSKPTAAEAAALSKLGWQSGDKVPQELAAALDEARNSLKDLPPPVSLSTPPLVMPKEQDISELSADKQAELQDLLTKYRGMQESEAEPAMPPGLSAAIHAAEKPALEDDTKSDTYAGTQVKKTDSDSDILRTLVPTHTCPNCSWDIRRPAAIEPDIVDKRTFLQALLGDIPFQKQYPLFDGNLIISVRTLTVAEVDACHIQSAADIKLEKVTNNDYLSQVMRYRVALQLLELATASKALSTLPDTYESWEKSFGGPTTEATYLPAIADYVYSEVLKNESLARSAQYAVMTLNRLVARMEANAENPNFWSGALASR